MTRVPARRLLVVGGLPGAGKSTLLRRVPPRPDRTVLDSEQVRDVLATGLRGLPYALWRPLVHTGHWLRLACAAAGPVPRLVVHEPATSPARRAALALLARATGRRALLVLLDAAPEQARAGQAARGRVVRDRAMARHERRWARLRPAAVRGRVPGFAAVRLLPARPGRAQVPAPRTSPESRAPVAGAARTHPR